MLFYIYHFSIIQLLNISSHIYTFPFNFFSFSSFLFLLFMFFLAPEIQLFSNCSILSDMFSLGLVMCSIFNQGHALIQANNSASTYLKQMEAVSTNNIHIFARRKQYTYTQPHQWCDTIH